MYIYTKTAQIIFKIASEMCNMGTVIWSVFQNTAEEDPVGAECIISPLESDLLFWYWSYPLAATQSLSAFWSPPEMKQWGKCWL